MIRRINYLSKMNSTRFAIFFCLFLSACVTEQPLHQLSPQMLQITEGQTVLISLNKGEIQITGSESDQLQVDMQTFFPDDFNYSEISTKDQIHILVNYDGRGSLENPVFLQISIPHGIQVKIDTEYASISIHDFEGDLEATSISGDILIQNVNGAITARSNRGDVKVERSNGKVSVVGNYGLLAFEDIRGITGASTIMGTITFSGKIRADDEVHLETDHGPVDVVLSPDSSSSVQVRSTSGNVSCLLSGITSSLRTCDGIFNSLGGKLTVRTVSGAVTLHMTP